MLKKVKNKIYFFISNFIYGLKLPMIKNHTINEKYVICALSKHNRLAALELYQRLANIKLSRLRRIFWCVIGKRLFFVVENSRNEVVGICVFYFNKIDIEQNTIHLGFIGIDNNHVGQGVGCALSKYTCEHYSFVSGLKGISTRVSLSNVASFTVKKKVGYNIVKEYFDDKLGEKRVYMINELKDYNNGI